MLHILVPVVDHIGYEEIFAEFKANGVSTAHDISSPVFSSLIGIMIGIEFVYCLHHIKIDQCQRSYLIVCEEILYAVEEFSLT